MCVPEAEADAQPLRFVEQQLRGGTGHGALVVVVGLTDVVDEPAREERRERELGIHHQLGSHRMRLVQHRDEAGHHLLTSVLLLHGPHLGGSDGEVARHRQNANRRGTRSLGSRISEARVYGSAHG